MNFLGMGPMELLLIMALALIFIGPGKLPEVMGQIGKAVRDFQKTTGELSSEFHRTLQAEIAETKAAVEGTPPRAQSTTPTPPVPVKEPASRSNGVTEAAPPRAESGGSWAWETSPGAAPDSSPNQDGEAAAKRASGSAPADEDLRPPY
jgi:TatA/E family protein of Tat protein translocase